MKLVWGNSFDNSNNYRAYEKKQMEKATEPKTLNGAIFGNSRMSKEKREEKLRQAEDKLLEQYRQEIADIEAEDEKTEDDKKRKGIKIAIVTEKIKQIEDARIQREKDAVLEEVQKQKNEAEKQKKAAEKTKQPDEHTKDTDIGIQREDIEGMVKLSVTNESIREMKRAKAFMNSEGKQLEIDISNDFGNAKYGSVKTGHERQHDFKHTQLAKLNKGIGNLEASIASEIREMADAVSKIAKDKAASNKTEVQKVEDQPENNIENTKNDTGENIAESGANAGDSKAAKDEGSIDVSL